MHIYLRQRFNRVFEMALTLTAFSERTLKLDKIGICIKIRSTHAHTNTDDTHYCM